MDCWSIWSSSTAQCGCGPGSPAAAACPRAKSRLLPTTLAPARASARLAAVASEVVFLDRDYIRLRLVKSAEEIAWLRTGAAMSDNAVSALAEAARPGATAAEANLSSGSPQSG